MERKECLSSMLEDIEKEIKDLSEYVEYLDNEYDTDDIENTKYKISDVLYKYLRILNKI